MTRHLLATKNGVNHPSTTTYLVHWSIGYVMIWGPVGLKGGEGNQDERVPYLIIWPDCVHPFKCHANNTQGTIFSALIHVNVNQDKRVPYFIT